MNALKPWRQVAVAHPDVLKGTFCSSCSRAPAHHIIPAPTVITIWSSFSSDASKV